MKVKKPPKNQMPENAAKAHQKSCKLQATAKSSRGTSSSVKKFLRKVKLTRKRLASHSYFLHQ